MEKLLEQLRDYLPPMFAASEIDSLTAKAILWRTIQNIRSAQKHDESTIKIPNDCFLKHGKKKVIIIRDPFLKWWGEYMLAMQDA